MKHVTDKNFYNITSKKINYKNEIIKEIFSNLIKKLKDNETHEIVDEIADIKIFINQMKHILYIPTPKKSKELSDYNYNGKEEIITNLKNLSFMIAQNPFSAEIKSQLKIVEDDMNILIETAHIDMKLINHLMYDKMQALLNKIDGKKPLHNSTIISTLSPLYTQNQKGA